MYTLDKQRMSIRHHQGKELKSTVAWHFIAALYLQFKRLPHSDGELSVVELVALPFFSRYNHNSLRTTIARTISRIDEHFPILSYNKKSSGPWRLKTPAELDIFPSLEAVQDKANYKTRNTHRLHFEDGRALFHFAQNIIDGDCLLHTGNQQQAALSSYRLAARSKTTLLHTTARLRQCSALMRLGDFDQAEELLDTTDWGCGQSYACFHAHLYRCRLDQLRGRKMRIVKSPDAVSVPDDITTALTMTLNAFAKRDQTRLLAEKPKSKGLTQRLAYECIEDLYNALFLRVRASHHDGVQQSAYNIANTYYILSNISNSPFIWPDISIRIFAWCDLCDEVCRKFEVGSDTYLNDLLRAETFARNPDTFHQALPAAQEALEKSQSNGNLYDQNELASLIKRLSGSISGN